RRRRRGRPCRRRGPPSISASRRKDTIVVMQRLASLLRSPFSFLFARSSTEERVAAYVIREHGRGRALGEILEDRYVQNRLTPQQRLRLLDRPEVIQSLGDETLEDDIVELARRTVVRPGRAHERTGLQPLSSQDGITRCRDGDNDVLRRRVAVTLARLGTHVLAELPQIAFGAAVRDDAFERGQG